VDAGKDCRLGREVEHKIKAAPVPDIFYFYN